MITNQLILDHLKHIIDPDLQKDIVSLGFIQNIVIDGSRVSLEIRLTTPACPIKEDFRRDAQQSLLKIPGITEVFITMTSQPRIESMSPTSSSNGLKEVGCLLAISSCKGGVGKSTVAAFMAHELAHRGYQVGLVDMDIHGPSIPTLFHLPHIPIKSNEAGELLPVIHQNLKLMSFGWLLGDAPAVMRGPIIARYVQQLLLNTAWGKLDYLIMDLPPGTGDVHLTITQTVRLNGAVIITTPHTLSLRDVSRGILMFEKVQVPILGVIENMSYFQPPNSDDKHYIFGKQGAQTLKDQFGVPTLAELPVLPQLNLGIQSYVANEYVMNAVDQMIRAVGKERMNFKTLPTIDVGEKDLTLRWKDGTTQTVSHFDLRLNSQDALSVNEMTGERRLQAKDIRPDIAPKKITPLGNYALGIEWNDGHSAGIYTYELIKKLSNR